jgi:bidirectional [NiFe] hydrogenase diaphorase subunit
MPDHPSGDKRFTMLDAAMKRHQFKADALLEVLHTAQQIFGHLQDDLLLYVARGLKQPPSRVYGVATFYHLFTFAPQGAHTCVVCLGTACYVKGAASVASTLEKALGIPPGRTRADGKATLQIARCFGACGLAPAAIFDGHVIGNVTSDKALDCVKGWLESGAR